MPTSRKLVIAACLLLPYAALMFPGLYNRSTPTFLGVPFFFTYQFAWVILTSMLLLFVHRQTKPH